MSSIRKFVLVRGDGWEGLYVDGVLATEGHSISVSEMATEAGLDFAQVECNYDWLSERGDLPSALEDVRLEGASND